MGNDTNEFIIVYGVNHVATGKCTYSNFAPYGTDIWNGVGAIHDSELAGTAEEYLPDSSNAKYLMSIRSLGTPMALRTALRFPMVREATAYGRISRSSLPGGSTWKTLQRSVQHTQRLYMIGL